MLEQNEPITLTFGAVGEAENTHREEGERYELDKTMEMRSRWRCCNRQISTVKTYYKDYPYQLKKWSHTADRHLIIDRLPIGHI